MPKKSRESKTPKGSKEAMRPTIWDQPLQIEPHQYEKITAAAGLKFTDSDKEKLEAIRGRYQKRRTRSTKPAVVGGSYREKAIILQEAIAAAVDAAKSVPLSVGFRSAQKKEFLEKLSDLDAISQRMRSRIQPEKSTTGDKPDLLTESLINDLAAVWRSKRKRFNRSNNAGSFMAFAKAFCTALSLDVSDASIDTAARKLIPKKLRKVSPKVA